MVAEASAVVGPGTGVVDAVVVVEVAVVVGPGGGAGVGAGPGAGAGAGAGAGVETGDFRLKKFHCGQPRPGAGVVVVAVKTVAFVEPRTGVSAVNEGAGIGVPGPLPESGVVGVYIPSGLTSGGKGIHEEGVEVVVLRSVCGPVCGS